MVLNPHITAQITVVILDYCHVTHKLLFLMILFDHHFYFEKNDKLLYYGAPGKLLVHDFLQSS